MISKHPHFLMAICRRSLHGRPGLWAWAAVALMWLAGGAAVWGQGAGMAEASVPDRMKVLDNTRPLVIGDRIDYQVLEEREPAITLLVDGNGEVTIPLAGSWAAVGKTPLALAMEVKAELERDYFHAATVLVRVRQDTSTRGKVSIVGEVKTNGTQPLPADAAVRLSEMILRSGGFTPSANPRMVTLIRQGTGEGENRQVFDVEAMFQTGDFAGDPVLVADDLILVPKLEGVGGEIFVLGQVNAPGAYPVARDDLTVSRAILGAGGFTRFAVRNKVQLVRNDPATGKQETFVLDVGRILDRGERNLDMAVRSGDIIRVDERIVNF